MTTSSHWHITGTKARFSLAGLTGVLDLSAPQFGLHELSHLPGAALFCLTPLAAGAKLVLSAASEPYARGDDLAATYEVTAGRPFRAQVYWRMLRATGRERNASPPAAGIELIVSVQTDLLDCDPRVIVTQHFPAVREENETCELLLASEGESGKIEFARPSGERFPLKVTADDLPGFSGGLVVRPGRMDWSAVAAIYPSDFSSLVVEGHGKRAGHFSYRLFDQGLEKGVIRRARLRTLFVPREGDLQAAERDLTEFLAGPIPLTT